MTSQISLSKLMRIDFRSRRWLIVLSSVIHFIFGPVVGLMSLTERGNYTLQYAIGNCFSIEYMLIEQFIVIVGAILVSLVGFRFLFSKRMMDLYGSIPVSRDRMFAAVYINNLLIWLIPFIGSIVLTSVVCIACDSTMIASILVMAAKSLAAGLLSFLLVYHMCLVAVMISGHPFVAISNIVMMGLAVIAVYGMVFYYASTFLNTFMQFPVSGVEVAWLSPIAAPFYMSGIFMGEYHEYIDYSANHYIVFIIGCIVMIVAELLIARVLFKRRKSELAEGGVKHRIYIIVIRSIVAMVAGVYVSIMFTLFGVGAMAVWAIVGITIGVVAGFGIINMILHRTGRAFFKDKFIMLGTLAVTIVIFVLFMVDAFGYDTYIPDKKYIADANIMYPNYYDDGVRFIVEDGDIVKEYYGSRLDGYTLSDVDAIYNVLELGVKYAAEEENAYASVWESMSVDQWEYNEEIDVTIRVNLTNGTHYYRSYRIGKEDIDVVKEIVESQEYREVNYPVSTGSLGINPDRIILTDCMEDFYTDISIEDSEVIELLLECYRRDFAENPVCDRNDVKSLECVYILHDENMADVFIIDDYLEPFSHTSYVWLGIGENYKRTTLAVEYIVNMPSVSVNQNNDSVNDQIKSFLKEILELE